MGSLSDMRIEPLVGDKEALQRSETHATPKASSRLQLMLRRWHTRRALLQLSDHELRDVGSAGKRRARKAASRSGGLDRFQASSLSLCHSMPNASKGERKCLPPGNVMCGTLANRSKRPLCWPLMASPSSRAARWVAFSPWPA